MRGILQHHLSPYVQAGALKLFGLFFQRIEGAFFCFLEQQGRVREEERIQPRYRQKFRSLRPRSCCGFSYHRVRRTRSVPSQQDLHGGLPINLVAARSYAIRLRVGYPVLIDLVYPIGASLGKVGVEFRGKGRRTSVMENPTLPVLSLICNKQATTPMQNAVSNSCVRIESQGIAVPVCRTSLRHST